MKTKISHSFTPVRAIVLFIAVAVISGTGWCREPKFPRPSGWVNDFAGVISNEYEARISVLIGELEQKTTAEIALATMKDIGYIPIEDYAVGLFEKWGIGKKGKDNGLLILVVLNQRKVKIEVGYGLEGLITDGMAGTIIRQKIAPAFKEGKYGQGLFNAAATAASLIAKDAGVELSSLKGVPVEYYQVGKAGVSRVIANIIFLALFFGLFGLRMFVFPLFLGGYWRGGRGGFGGMGGFGGGFGGFGGGMSGGGGASGGW